jgi:hypothetical protein
MLPENEEALDRLLELHGTGRTTARRLRLFCCARFRQDAQLVRSRQPLRAVQLGEDLADGLVGAPQVRNFTGFWNPWLPLAPDAGEAALAVLEEAPWCDLPGGLALLEEIFGPEELPAFSPDWRTAEVLAVAQGAYDDRTPRSGLIRRPARLVLADALLDAGCQDPTLQRHLRSWARHPAGCWVLDSILGRS